MDYESKLIFTGDDVWIGRFHCPANSSLWKNENIAGQLPMLVFPRTCVGIEQACRRSVVTSPNDVMFYNRNQPYRRTLIGSQPDICDYFYVRPQTIVDVFQSLGQRLPDDPASPFRFSHAPCQPQSYLLQRLLSELGCSDPCVDSLFVEETFLELLPEMIGSAIHFHDPFENRKPDRTQHRHREIAESAKTFVGSRFKQQIKLADVAAAVGSSPFHLCRIFRRHTGRTIHRFLMQLRIRHSLSALMDTDQPITRIALDHGFASHSHFTSAFRAAFHESPDQLRRSSARATKLKMLTQRKSKEW